jgi:RNA polymerase sigma-54 factor
MAVSQRLEFRQTQSLVMTPQLQQAIKLLQLSNLELSAYVEQELERNPLLEQEEPGTDKFDQAADGAEGFDGQPAIRTEETTRDTAALTASDTLPRESEAPLDSDYENVYDDDRSGGWSEPGGSGRGNADFDGEGFSLEERLSEQTTLRNHLVGQLQLAVSDPAVRLIGLHLIDMLDEAGYLRGDLNALATQLGCRPADIEATLKIVQGFDPAGLFARDLRECLALQLADRNRLDPAMAALLDNLDLLAGRELGKLKRICGIDDEDLVEMIAEIKALDPKPGLAFDAPAAETLIPDIMLRSMADGGWQIELNSDTLPRVLVNRQYHAALSKRSRDKADKEFLTDCLQSANWLVRALHQRATTILKVATEIVRQQDAFFRKGVAHLRPLTLREVAEAIEMHESTVSRVTTNKYMTTPRGIYELKYFFTAAIAGTSGDSVSAEAVRHRIRGLIEAESPSAVLSDDTLVELLRRDGVDIARRTVAKYREALRIPSSVQRRRDKAVHL